MVVPGVLKVPVVEVLELGYGGVSTIHTQHVLLESMISRKIGDGTTERFWKDVWCGEGSFRGRFSRLYAAATDQDAVVSDYWTGSGWSCVWSREIDGGRTGDQLMGLMQVLSHVQLGDGQDRWSWELEHNGTLTVSSIRHALDDYRLHSPPIPTHSTHLFVGCDLAVVLWPKVAMWLEVDIPSFINVEAIFTLVDQLFTYRKRREVVDTVCCTLLWIMWNYRHAVLFSDSVPKKSALFDSVVDYSFDWFLNRNSSISISRNSWTLNLTL
ncbi:hypothetical protein LXL04_025165 [Taraxacum kok-saghyz]